MFWAIRRSERPVAALSHCRGTRLQGWAGVAAVVGFLASSVSANAVGLTTRLSVTAGGVQAPAGGLSPNGRYAAYDYECTTGRGIYVRDLATGSYFQAASTPSGTSGQPIAFRGDGSELLFESNAPGLVADDADVFKDLFVVNVSSRAITRITQATQSSSARGSTTQHWGGSWHSTQSRLRAAAPSCRALLTSATDPWSSSIQEAKRQYPSETHSI